MNHLLGMFLIQRRSEASCPRGTDCMESTRASRLTGGSIASGVPGSAAPKRDIAKLERAKSLPRNSARFGAICFRLGDALQSGGDIDVVAHQVAIGLFDNATNNRGFWLGLPWQRQGLMTEACEVVTDYWFDVLGFPLLRVPKAISNESSRRISEAQGMRVVERGERDYVSGRLPTEIWEITAEEWARRRQT